MNENDTVAPASPPPPPPAAPLAAAGSGDERMWAMLGHLSALTAFVTGIGCLLGPLLVWLIKRDTQPFAAEQAKEALNFNITCVIAAAVLWLFALVTLGIGLILVVPLCFVLFIAWLVLTIIAALKANGGEHYRYPYILRLVN